MHGISALLVEIERFYSVKTVTYILGHLARIVAVAEDVQQRLVGHEVESGKHFLLLLEIIVERLLARLDLHIHAPQLLFAVLHTANLNHGQTLTC